MYDFWFQKLQKKLPQIQSKRCAAYKLQIFWIANWANYQLNILIQIVLSNFFYILIKGGNHEIFRFWKINDWQVFEILYFLSLTHSIASDIRSFRFERFMNKINITVIIRPPEEILISVLNKICITCPYFHLSMFFRYTRVILRLNSVVE